jgi:hypothetical protein
MAMYHKRWFTVVLVLDGVTEAMASGGHACFLKDDEQVWLALLAMTDPEVPLFNAFGN